MTEENPKILLAEDDTMIGEVVLDAVHPALAAPGRPRSTAASCHAQSLVRRRRGITALRSDGVCSTLVQ